MASGSGYRTPHGRRRSGQRSIGADRGIAPGTEARRSPRTEAQPSLPLPARVADDGAPTLVLRAGKEKSLLRRHPWLFASGIEQVAGDPVAGDTVRLAAADGTFLAWAAYSPSSVIRARAWSFVESETIDEAFIQRRIQEAVARRADLAGATDALRLVNGEGDRLPGLVVDRYAGQLVAQILAPGVERLRDVIAGALLEATGCASLYERSDAAARTREGLPLREGPIEGVAPNPVSVTENGVRYAVDVVAGHKTGFYIDQRDNRALVAASAAGRRVLNCFCYTGGFTLAALHGGAVEAVSIDSSAEALATAAANERLNGFAPSTWIQADAFEALRQLLAEGRQFDLVVLDPPKFAPTMSHVDRAARAYKEINMKALRLLAPGGLLFTFSCSSAIGVDLFQKIIAGAVFDAGVEAQMLHRLQAGADHPMTMTHPEGEYLKGLLLRRMG